MDVTSTGNKDVCDEACDGGVLAGLLLAAWSNSANISSGGRGRLQQDQRRDKMQEIQIFFHLDK